MNIQMLRDATFQNGFSTGVEKGFIVPDIKGESTKWHEPPETTLNRWYSVYSTKLPFQNKEPEWIIAEYFSKYQLSLDHTVKIGSNGYSINNESKRLERKPGGGLVMEIVGRREYKKPRQLNEGWPSFLIMQRFAGEYLSSYRSLTMSTDVDFLSFKNHMGDESDPILHTLQLNWYLQIGNLNPKSKGYGDFFFFGLPLIDCPRYKITDDYEAEDYGKSDATHKFIRLLDGHRFMNKPLEVGTNLSFSHVCLSDIKETFEHAQAHGYMTSSRYEDLEIISTNFGFEDTGTFDGRISLNYLSLEKEI